MWSSELQQTIIQSCKTAEFRLLEPLSRHTSFRIGGPAAVMVFPKTVEELKPLLQTASAHGITPYILGAGTNVLAPDEGLQAIVICLKDALTSIRLLDKTRMEVFRRRKHGESGCLCQKSRADRPGICARHSRDARRRRVYERGRLRRGNEANRGIRVTVLTMGGEEKMLSGEESAFAIARASIRRCRV